MPCTSLGEIIRAAALEIGGDSPRLDVELLACQAFALSRAQLIARAESLPDEAAAVHFRDLVARRAQGWPVAYLTGAREFWSLELEITPAVLIPRPETELLVELALARAPSSRPCRIADLGTGSGAIALALARERPLSRIVAIDASAESLEVAKRNAARHAPGAIGFRRGEWFEPIAAERFDLIVSNPPYVAEGDPHLDSGDVRFEPRVALVAGPDGLDAIRHIVRHAAAHLEPGGWLLLEHGHEQGAAVRALFTAAGFDDISTAPDLAGRERVTAGMVPS